MQLKPVLSAILLCSTFSAFAAASSQGCESSGNTAAGCSSPISNEQGQNQRQIAVGVGGSGGSATGGSAQATGGSAVGGNQSQSVNSTAAFNGSVSVNTNESRQVGVAPNVGAFPTANCRVAGGASAGWLGGAFGFTGSVVDETCETIEVSKQLNQLGLSEAAMQAMCLVEKARLALEASGVKCRVSLPSVIPVNEVKP